MAYAEAIQASDLRGNGRHGWSAAFQIVVVIVAVLPMACNRSKPAGNPPTPVHTTQVQTIHTGNSAKYSANIVPYTQVDLAFKSNGYVEKIRQVRSADGSMRAIDEGDWVAKGTVLAVVQQQDYQDKLQQAKAQLARGQADYDHAKLNYDRTSILYSSQSATKPEYDSARASLDSAAAAVSSGNAAVSEAKVALAYCSLQAPFDGWIVRRSVDVGSLVGPATNGFSIANTRSVKAVFGVPDIAIQRVKLGARQAVTTDSLPEKFAGRITSISPAADAKSRVYPVEVTIQNPHNLLKSGMIASIYIDGQTLPHAVTVIPLSAVVRNPGQQDGFAVLVTERSGDSVTAHIRPVELGDAYGNMIAVTSGLGLEDQVISTGATLVKSGDPVRVIP